MKLLSKFTPAETLLIKNNNSAELKNLMKYTFMDLLLKKVIEIKDISSRPHPRDKARSYTYVVPGKNLTKYNPKNHELIFINAFLKSPALKVLFKNYVSMVYGSANGKSSYKKQIKSNKEIDSYFKQSFLFNLFGVNKLTNNGITIQQEIKDYLIEIDTNINRLLTEDKEKGLELLLQIKGNIFLLKNLDFELLKKIDKELLNQHKKQNGNTYNADSDWWFYIDFYEESDRFDTYLNDFDDTLNTFESDYDSFDSSDSSGWSSCDSGCSGCGGCD